MLTHVISDAAIAEAKRHSHAEVTKAHLLSALLTCSGVRWPRGEPPKVDLARAIAAPGNALSTPDKSPELDALIDRCSTPEQARHVAVELIKELGLEGQSIQTLDLMAPSPSSTSAPASDSDLAAMVEPIEVIDHLVACLTRLEPLPVVLHGRPGSGRTTVGRLLRARLQQDHPGRTVHFIQASALITNPDTAIDLSRRASIHDVIIFDDADLLLGLGQQSFTPVSIAVGALLAAHDPGVVLILPTNLRGRFALAVGRLAERCVSIEVPPLTGNDLDRAIANGAERLAAHHKVTYSAEALTAAIAPAGMGGAAAQPGLGIERLDAAGAAAAVRKAPIVTAGDVVLGRGSTSLGTGNPNGLADRLATAVLGQQHVVDQLANRLLLTRTGLDLRPERPDGVFLFVGPTGVGKTALARALALELYGSESNLVRLDMSEYAEPWAISRLTGPQPGYVGSNEPESWLTTKVRNRPDSVVLLDEIEKAHPDVWNVFLQVFDAGRLTDSRGEIADFSSTIVIMTSNLGTGVSERRPMGFNADTDTSAGHEARVLEVVEKSMRPELLNRIDATVVFRALDRRTIAEIARAEVDRLVSTLGPRGFVIQVDDEAVQFIADDGYDEKYGARHVHRSLERHLLEPLAGLGPGQWTARAADGHLVWAAS